MKTKTKTQSTTADNVLKPEAIYKDSKGNARIVTRNSSPSRKWGIFVLGSTSNMPQWVSIGFFKTRKAALEYARATGRNVVLVARRMELPEVRRAIE